MHPSGKIYSQYLVGIFLLALLSCVSCKKDEPEVVPNAAPTGNNTLPALADSLFTINYNSAYLYYGLLFYPGFGNWDTVLNINFSADQDTISDFNFRSNNAATWIGTSTPYHTSHVFSLNGDTLNFLSKSIIHSGVATFPPGAVIDSSLNFDVHADLHVHVPALSLNYWPIMNQSYNIGIKLIRNNAIHYGWIDIQHQPGGYFLLKSVNYDLIPESPVTIVP